MKIKKVFSKALSLALTLVVLVGNVVPISTELVYAETVSSYTYSLSPDGNATITAYDIDVGGTAPTIPATLDGHPVTDIGFQAFVRKGLTGITLPEGLLRIASYSFEGNDIENLTIPNSVVSIGDGAFYKTKLTSLILGTSLRSVGSDTFSTSKLTSVVIPSNIISFGDNIFKSNGPNIDSGCVTDWVSGIGGVWHLVDSIWVKSPYSYTVSPEGNATITAYDTDVGGTSPVIPATLDEHPVTDIGFQAFVRKGLTGVILPESLQHIASYSFEGNSIEHLIIPNSVISIGDGAFYKTELTSLSLGTGLLSIGSDTFSTSKLTSVSIPSNVTSLGGNAFKFNGQNGDSSCITDWVSGVGGVWHLIDLTWVKSPYSYTVSTDGNATITDYDADVGGTTPSIPSTLDGYPVTDIGFQAFIRNGLTSATLPEGLLHIAPYSFEGNNLENLIIPNSVLSIGDGAFYKNELTSLSLGAGLLTIGSDTFSNSKLTSVAIPPNVTSLGSNIFKFNGANKDSGCITDWVSGIGGIWNLLADTWIKTSTLPIKENQSAPIGLSAVTPTAILTDGRIDGVSILMEFKLNSDTEYTAVTSTNTLNLREGTYNVRFKAKEGFNAGDVITITILPYSPLVVVPEVPPVVVPEVPPVVVPEVPPVVVPEVPPVVVPEVPPVVVPEVPPVVVPEVPPVVVPEVPPVVVPEVPPVVVPYFRSSKDRESFNVIDTPTLNMVVEIGTTFIIDSKLLATKMAELAQVSDGGKDNCLEIPLGENANSTVLVTGDIVNKMKDSKLDFILSKSNVKYKFQPAEIEIATIANQLGVRLESLKDITFEIRINKSQTVSLDNYLSKLPKSVTTFSIDAVEFEIIAKAQDANGIEKEVMMPKLQKSVTRILELPQNLDPTKITTGIMLNVDGTLTQAPAAVYQENGKWIVKINSLTNSAYSVIWNKQTVASVKDHWSEAVVNEMASRLIVTDSTKFEPDKPITRAEFSEYLIKSLGFYKEDTFDKYATILSDVDVTVPENSKNEGVTIKYVDSSVIEKNTITREEAMTMYARVMKAIEIPENNTNRLATFKDKSSISKWALPYVTQVVDANIFSGRAKGVLAPKGILTHAEALTALRNLLVSSKLINK